MKPSPRAHKFTEFLAILVFALIVLGAAACSKEQANEAELGLIQAQSLTFSGVPVGASRVFSATVTNSGKESATRIQVSGLSAPFSLEKSTCGNSLAPKASCQLKVAFAPTSVGSFEAKVAVSFFTGKQENEVSFVLTATSVTPASLSLAGVDDFLTVVLGGEVTQILTVTNNGQYEASELSFLGIGEPYHLVPGTCGATLAAGASCTVTILFRPVDTIPANQTFSLEYVSGAANRSVSYGLTGIGQTRALLNITGDLDFGDRRTDQTETRTFTLTNDGQWDATAIAMTSAPGDAFSLGATDCSDYLAPGASCQFEVTFAPADIGPASSFVEFSYEDGLNTGITSSAVFVGNGISPR